MKTEIRNNMMLKILNHGLVFLINIVMVRLIGGSESGIVINHIYRLTALCFVLSMGLDYAAIKSISENSHLYRLWHKLLSFSFLIAIPVSVAVLMLFPVFEMNQNQALWVPIFFTAGQTMVILFQGLLSAVKRFFTINIISLASNVLFFIWLCYFYVNDVEGVNTNQLLCWIAINMLIQGLIFALVSFPLNQKDIQKADVKTIRVDVLHGLTIMFTTLIYFIFIRTDHFFAEKFADSLAFGQYVQCGKIGQYFLLFASMVSSMLLPYISDKSARLEQDSWYAILKPYIFIMIASAIGIGVFGRFLFPYLFGSDFAEMHLIMNVLLPGYLALGLLTLLNAFYIGKGILKRMVLGDVGGLVILLSMNLIFSRNGNVYIIASISTCCYVGLLFFMGFGIKKRLGL